MRGGILTSSFSFLCFTYPLTHSHVRTVTHAYRASYGTTKYCSYFLRGQVDPNTDCMFLHELGDDTDSFTKEDMQAGYCLLYTSPSPRD